MDHNHPHVDQHIAEDFLHDHLQYKQFIKESLEQDPQYFVKLSKGQKPNYLIIGCADSRVPPNELTKLKPGELFIHRNIANQVIPADMNVNSVIQYAVEHLKIKHIIVMGHSSCGGVKAAIQGVSCGGILDLWLAYIKDVYEKYEIEINELESLDKQVERLSELNIVEQVLNVWKNPYVQKSWKKQHPVWVHGWIFRFETGLLEEIVADKGMPEDMKAHLFKFDEHTNQRRPSLMPQIIRPELLAQKPPETQQTYELELKSYQQLLPVRRTNTGIASSFKVSKILEQEWNLQIGAVRKLNNQIQQTEAENYLINQLGIDQDKQSNKFIIKLEDEIRIELKEECTLVIENTTNKKKLMYGLQSNSIKDYSIIAIGENVKLIFS